MAGSLGKAPAKRWPGSPKIVILSYPGLSLWLASLVVGFSKVFNAAKEDPPLEPLERAWPCQHLEFGLWLPEL